MVSELIWADYFALIVIGLSALIGLIRGMKRELLSLIAWLVAFGLTLVLVRPVADYLAQHISVPPVRMVLAFGGLFLLVLFIGGAVNIILARSLRTRGLSAMHRLTGAACGVVRGLLLLLLLVMLAGLTPIPQDPWWQQSVLVPYFQSVAVQLAGILPAPFAGFFTYPGV